MYYPFFVELDGMNCLVIGGGSVAFRKAVRVHEFGARIRVVAPEIQGGFSDLGAALVKREFHDDDIDGADFVIAASDSEEVNERAVSICRNKRIPINAGYKGNIFFGAVMSGDGVTIGVSSGGKDIKKAVRIRNILEDNLK